MTEVFLPKNGRPIHTFRFCFMARLYCALFRQFDYAPAGAGWSLYR